MMEPGTNWLIVTEVCAIASIVALLVSAAALAHYACRIARTIRSFRARANLLARRASEAAAGVRRQTRLTVDRAERIVEILRASIGRIATSLRGIRCQRPAEQRNVE